MRSQSEKLELVNKPTKAVLLAAASSLLIGGCTIDSYLTNTNGVPCDTTRTIAHFKSDVSRLSFITAQMGAEKLVVTVTRQSPHDYLYDVHPVRPNPVLKLNIISSPVSDGTADPDFSFATDTAVWSVDVRPKEEAVVISGNCS